MGIVGHLQHDGRNDFNKYNYTSAAKVYTVVRNELSARRISVAPDPDASEIVKWFVHPDNKITTVYKWVGALRLDSPQGVETWSLVGFGQGKDAGDKAVMKAETAALKYALSSVFLISWGDDPEATESAEGKPRVKRKATTSKPKTNGKSKTVDVARVIGAMQKAKAPDELKKVVDAAANFEFSKEDSEKLKATYEQKKKEFE